MRQQQSTASSMRERVNKPSRLLEHDENELVFSLLGRRCQAMCTAVVQLFTTDSPAHSAWIRRLNGIACFVRDSSKRSYFIRVYCLLKNELVWEEEMYDSILINKPREYVITFEGKDCMIALSFAHTDETNAFFKAATTTVSNRTKRRQDRKSRKFSPNHTSQPNDENDSTVVLRNNPISTPIHQFNHIPQPTALSGANNVLKDKKRSNRKLTKADISMPTNFKHVVHVGWSAQKGFDLKGDEVSSLNAFLEKAGVSEQQLNDRETRDFIYDFIQCNNVLDSVKSETEVPPPPVPSRHNGTQRHAPPPPPAPNATRLSSGPTGEHQKPRLQQQRGPPPSRPPPIDFASKIQKNSAPVPPSSAPAPPPPPPPPMINNAPVPPPLPTTQPPISPPMPPPSLAPPAPIVPDARGALMDSIRGGIKLKKVDPATLSTGSSSDTRSDLLMEIQKGIELKPAGDRPQRDSNTKSTGTDALADALRRALESRNKQLHSSDDNDSDSTDNAEWDD